MCDVQERRQPGVPATAEIAAATGAQRESMQVRRPEQHQPLYHEASASKKEAANAAKELIAAAEAEKQPLLPQNHSQRSDHGQVTDTSQFMCRV